MAFWLDLRHNRCVHNVVYMTGKGQQLMPTTPAQLVNLYGFSASRRIFSLTEVERRARQRGLPMIADHALVSLEHDRGILQRSLIQDADSPYGAYSAEAGVVDNLLDHAIVGFHGYLDAQARIFIGQDRGKSGEVLRNAAFPRGPGAITRLPYAQQHAQVEAMLDRLDHSDLDPHLAALPDVAELLERIRTLNAEYGRVLHDYPVRLTGDELRVFNARGQNFLAEVVAMILAHFAVVERVHPDAAAEGREYLLEPILRQNQAIRQGRRRRRQPRDIDPATGEEFPTSEPDLEDEPESELEADPELDSPELDSGDDPPEPEIEADASNG